MFPVGSISGEFEVPQGFYLLLQFLKSSLLLFFFHLHYYHVVWLMWWLTWTLIQSTHLWWVFHITKDKWTKTGGKSLREREREEFSCLILCQIVHQLTLISHSLKARWDEANLLNAQLYNPEISISLLQRQSFFLQASSNLFSKSRERRHGWELLFSGQDSDRLCWEIERKAVSHNKGKTWT